MINVKVVKVPGNATDQTLNDGATAADALRVAGLSRASNEELRINGQVQADTTVLRDGDRVMLVQGAKGNAAKKPAAKPVKKPASKPAKKPAKK